MSIDDPVNPARAELGQFLTHSPFISDGGGFCLYENLVSDRVFIDLTAEAMAGFWNASDEIELLDDREDGRGGHPRQSLRRGSAGPVQTEFYQSQRLREFLSNETQLTVVPTGRHGSYSYYSREGDHMALHLDQDSCDLVVLTLLYDNSAPKDIAGAMVVYPDSIGTSLSAIRTHPRVGALPLKLARGQTLVMFGGLVPHFVAPIRSGHVRVMSVLCFRVSRITTPT